MNQKSAIVIGAGIIGLATARALAVRNYKVTVIEKNGFASGASIRNFGMIWPIGQRQGKDFETARLSRAIWKEVLNDAGIWFDEVGSLHLAYKKDEWDVLEELADVFRDRGYQLLNGVDTMGKSPAVVDKGLMGSLYSRDEMIVDPRKTCAAISSWLNEKHKVSFYFDKPVTEIKYPAVWSNKEFWEADEIFICTGSDFDQLYGTAFNDVAPTRSKLQMMRIAAQPGQWRIGPALCGSLSLTHYKSFAQAGSLAALQKRLIRQSISIDPFFLVLI